MPVSSLPTRTLKEPHSRSTALASPLPCGRGGGSHKRGPRSPTRLRRFLSRCHATCSHTCTCDTHACIHHTCMCHICAHITCMSHMYASHTHAHASHTHAHITRACVTYTCTCITYTCTHHTCMRHIHMHTHGCTNLVAIQARGEGSSGPDREKDPEREKRMSRVPSGKPERRTRRCSAHSSGGCHFASMSTSLWSLCGLKPSLSTEK